MSAKCLMLAVAMTIAIANGADGANYLITASQFFTPGITYKIGVTHLTSNIQSARAELKSVSSRNGSSRVIVTAEPDRILGDNCVIDITVTDSSLNPSDSFHLTVNFTDSVGREFTNSTRVHLQSETSHILIQTDKSIYQPGHLVKYRVLALDSSLRPEAADFQIKIRDSRRNVIDSSMSNSSSRSPQMLSIAEGELRLSHVLNEGVWRIDVKTDRGSESKDFVVEKYILPKFELNLKVPDFVFSNDSEFGVNASVLYTNGKPVPGTMKVKFGAFNPCRSCKPRYDMVIDRLIETTAGDSKVNLAFNLTKWRTEVLQTANVRWSTWYTFRAFAEVQFTEMYTGEKKSVKKEFSIHKTAYKISLEAEEAEFFIPGFAIPVNLRIKRPNGVKFEGRVSDSVKIQLQYKRRGKQQQKLMFSGDLQAKLDATLMVQVPADADYSTVTIKAVTSADPVKEASVSVNPYMAVTDSFVTGEAVRTDDSVTFTLKKGGAIKRLAAVSLSSSRVTGWSVSAAGVSDLTASFTKEESLLTRSVAFVGFGVTESGEVVASATEFEFEDFLDSVTLSSNLTDNTAEPQQSVAIDVTAKPNSLVFLTGIDHSVNLLKTGQDILRSTVMGKINGGGVRYRRWRPWTRSVTTDQILKNNQIILLTDGFYYSEAATTSRRFYSNRMKSDMSLMASAGSAEMAPPPQPNSEVQVRKYFPETMIWQAVQTDSEGHARHESRLPDTITSWDVTAFSLTPRRPIQTMEKPLKLVTHKSFFVRPVLPKSVVYGEQFILKVLVFNYVSRTAVVKVTLKLKDVEFDASAVAESDLVRQTPTELTVSLTAGRQSMAAFKLTPRSQKFVLTAGEARPPTIDIVVVGSVSFGESVTVVDEVRRSLTVRSPGRLVEETLTALAGVGDCSDGCNRVLKPQESKLPIVPDSELAYCTVFGDLLGSSVNNLDSLVRIPTGCGEQNLGVMAPAVSLYSYLQNTKAKVPQDIVRRGLEAMKIGFQRQLTFRRRDGSFSAFGDRDQAGNVWLTAFTLSVFVRVAEFIAVGSVNDFSKSGEFLLRQQEINGRFTEPPESFVFDSSLQGSVASSSLASDAFVCVSLVDVLEFVNSTGDANAKRLTESLRRGIAKCTMYLTEAVRENSNDEGDVELLGPLNWALTAYALRRTQKSRLLDSIVNRDDVTSALAKAKEALAELAVEVPEGVAWKRKSSWGRSEFSPETAAYVLMEQTLSAEEPDTRVLRWLLARRDSAGGFGTTQATVVCVRAVAEFAERFKLTSADDSDLRVSVTWQKSGVSQPRHELNVTRQTALLLRAVALASGHDVTGGQASVTVEGEGLALLTLIVRYHVSDAEAKRLEEGEWLGNSSLAIRVVKSDPVSSDQVNGTFCVKATDSDGMHILTVSAPSGFAPSSHSSYGWRSPTLRRVDMDSDRMVFYFSALTSQPICVFATWTRTAPVLRTHPQAVTLQRYYVPSQQVTGYYMPDKLKDAGICDVCPECSGC